ncbi:MAG: cytochrome P450 [Nocardioides sp.]|uniref:cytochrome P450 n=1 Tax=Nocardioides sp. TaxID=35761 RepID=UPI0039E3179F
MNQSTVEKRESVFGPDFDPWDPRYLIDLAALYAELREREPVHWNERRGLWFVTRYDDVASVLGDRERFSCAQYNIDKPHMVTRKEEGARYQPWSGPTMVTTEPPEQTRLRRGSARAFSVPGLQRLTGRVEAIADRLLDRLDGAASMDVIADFAYPLPVYAIAELLGVPEVDQERFLALALADREDPGHDPNATPEMLAVAASHGEELRAFVEEIIARKRLDPGEDLISALIASQQADGLTASETLDTVHLMMEAGHITTVNLIGNGLDLLLDHPDQWSRLRDEPELMASAVKECLRLVGPVQFTGRTAKVDVEIDGQLIRAGEAVIPLIPAANRDPRQFEDPDVFDVARNPTRHLGFGVGVHVCIGQSLARLETQIAFARLLERTPDLRRSGDVTWNTSFELRGLTTLPVAW